MEVETDESILLPSEWVYDCTGTESDAEKIGAHEESRDGVSIGIEAGENSTDEKLPGPDQGKEKKKAKAKKVVWGPIIPERRSKRNPQDGVTVLERAQVLKRKSNLEEPKGKKPMNISLSSADLDNVASKIGLEIPIDNTEKQMVLDVLLDSEISRIQEYDKSYLLQSFSNEPEKEDSLGLSSYKLSMSNDGCSVHISNESHIASGSGSTIDDLSNINAKSKLHLDSFEPEGQVSPRWVEDKNKRSIAFGSSISSSKVKIGSMLGDDSKIVVPDNSYGISEEDDPQTPVVLSSKYDLLDLLEDEIEKAWTKVAHRKKK